MPPDGPVACAADDLSGPAGPLLVGHVRAGLTVAPGPIMLAVGWHDPETDRGSGLVHIEARHGVQIRTAGFSDAAAFVAHVAGGHNEIRQDSGGQLFLVCRDPARSGPNDPHAVAIACLMPVKGSVWTVATAGRFKSAYIKKINLLWQAVHTAAPQPNGLAAPSKAPPDRTSVSVGRLSARDQS